MDKKDVKPTEINFSDNNIKEKISNGVSKEPPPNINKYDILPPPPPKPKKD